MENPQIDETLVSLIFQIGNPNMLCLELNLIRPNWEHNKYNKCKQSGYLTWNAGFPQIGLKPGKTPFN